MKSNLRNEIKSYIVRQGMTMQEVVDLPRMSLKTISSAPITRAIQVPAKSITSERLRFINGCWNVFREH